MNTGTQVEITPTNTETQLLPLSSPNPLMDPINNDATCDSTSADPHLSYSCSVLIPVEVDWSSVTVEQYYTHQNESQIDIYFVYDKTGPFSGQNKQYDLIITANNTDFNGNEIPLSNITDVFSLVVNEDPKTSRGTITRVQPTGSY